MTRARRVAERPVVFRFRPPRDVNWADLRGEMVDFARPLELAQRDDGWLERVCWLGPGTYSYKFRLADGEWLLDPLNPRTRSIAGIRNSLLVVEGAAEPLLHAPTRPWIGIEDDGRLVIRAGLRRGYGEVLQLRWDEGHGPREVQMEQVSTEDEHLLFETHLPASAKWVSYLFVLRDGRCVGAEGGAGQAFRVAPKGLQSRIPSWWKDAVLYTVFVDRFRRGNTTGRWESKPDRREDERLGGDLEGVIESLEHLEALGATVLHLTPIWVSHSTHRYDAIDPRKVDPSLGGEDALRRLLEKAHDRGLRVILDLAVTHVHRDFFAFRDVRERGPNSPYWSWFRIFRYPFVEGYEPGYDHYQKGQWEEPLLNTDNPEVMDYLVGTFEHWTRFGVDGFRVDAAADVPLELLSRIGEAVRRIEPETVVYGEVIPEHLHRYLDHGLDGATDFLAQEALYSWLWRGEWGGRQTSNELARRRFSLGSPGYRAISFTATHDQHRLLTLTGEPELARLAHLLVLTRSSVPAIYYGDEIGMSAPEASRGFEGAWPDRQPMDWDEATWDREILELIRRAIEIRRENDALRLGDERPLRLENDEGDEEEALLAFRRTTRSEIVDVVLNAALHSVTVSLAPGAPSGARPLLLLGEVELDHDAGRVTLGPRAGAVLAREPEREVTDALDLVLARSSELSLEAFRRGSTELLALPRQLYLTVTEVCNLRCAHCLTHAPAITREGRAREMRPWLLEALREPLGAAEYVGFSHGGESLTSPFLFDVLRFMQRARYRGAGERQIHLLTNGMLLDGERARRLLDHGVTSLAVSLDGASAATNDRVRIGSRFETIVSHLREVMALRERLGVDLRVGLSCVVGGWNAQELPALGRLALELGLDWIKIEEMFPASLVARQELLLPLDRKILEGMAELRLLLEPTGTVLVDHLDPPEGCWCAAATRPDVEAFRRADDFANRARFNPCRLAWEQACIEPDGTVHLVDYDQPALGNLLESSFLELWNSQTAKGIRTDALRRVPTELRRRCKDPAKIS